MIVVKVELWSAITGVHHEIGRTYISNDGVGSDTIGNYDVAVCRRGSNATGNPARTGKVLGYPRRAYNIWRLVSRALLSAFPEEQTVKPGRAYASQVTPEVMRGLIGFASVAETEGQDQDADSQAALAWLKASCE